ncbi:hypothetical protein [Nonomuraea sp. NPDC005650]|uniref:hypothetical protein n=1 Tax=Nonomuraea sp. NPDC005650 TaxID=3157045 RepID=UPI0033B99AA7
MYGVDLGTPGLLRERTGPWLRTRIIGLFSEPSSRLFRTFRDRREQPPPARRPETSFDDY